MTVKGILHEERRGKEGLSHGEQKRERGKTGRELTWLRLEETGGRGWRFPVDGGMSRSDRKRESQREKRKEKKRVGTWGLESKGEAKRKSRELEGNCGAGGKALEGRPAWRRPQWKQGYWGVGWGQGRGTVTESVSLISSRNTCSEQMKTSFPVG